MTTETRRSVGVTELAKGVIGLAPDLPAIVKHAPGLLTRKPTATTTMGAVFAHRAAKHPERPFIRFEGRSLSYGECNRRVNRYASLLESKGIRTGDVVAILAKNDPTTLLAMLATVKLGAVAGMINYNQRGHVLEHSFSILGSNVLILDPGAREALDSVGPESVPAEVLDFDALDAQSTGLSEDNPAVTATLPAKTVAFYIFTSGTTGLPKASVMSHFRWLANMSGIGGMGVRLRRDDTMYVSLPLYHNNALSVSLGAVLGSGACMAIGRQFSASRFWDEVITNRATAFCYIGEICRYLLAQPAKPTDRAHDVRIAVGNGMRAEIWDEFTERFGIERVVEFYSASEANLAFINVFNVDRTAGFSPLPYKIVEYDGETGGPLRGSDGRVRVVRKGEPGLLISEINEHVPFDGYTDAEATAKKVVTNAFKDGDRWFNTGDLVRDQGFSHVAFVDRLGDTFRWKGENVATTEVEGALDSASAVNQSVVYGVEVPGCDGKAGMAAVTIAEGTELDGQQLAAQLYASLPNYAVPLFVRIVDQLEQTSTFKTMKVELREQGYTAVGSDPLYVLAGRSKGYVPFYPEYPSDVAEARAPRN
ncbi:long-chain-acyl-CoA synthetase [Williamsia sp. CHRR-6]|uniref:long-chain-acyl-CoA synthetase n=1 Tax=Williamsia sp. CHRR-6 TaxID=2835871 RepID=UPI001BDAF867|nr:long-chain-acyl-CoA synthetase [Williamsia sp. CHRR-6]MBT0565516.1 long-chain-acyl-CoA synthetase [Williamsia sp. CHRR-6]